MMSPRLEREAYYWKIRKFATGDNDLREHWRTLCLNDLYFLCTVILKRQDMQKDWLFDRCMEVQESPNFYLDLWSREHYKSTIITFGYTIQDILYDPEITIGLFSITSPTAKKFLSQIRAELSDNKELKYLFPDVLYDDPKKEATKWSVDYGLVVKRKSNPKEATIEAHGLDSMPTGRHFKIRIYDDVITERHVTNPEMIQKAIQGWELSLNLGSAQPTKRYQDIDIERYIGTRYHLNDPYREIMQRGAAKKRIYPGTDNGEVDGNPVLWTPEFMAKKRRNMGRYVFACQILQNPKADDKQGFDREWLRYWQAEKTAGMNLYLLCDPASEKKQDSDYTAMGVLGLGADRNIYVVHYLRDRLNLTERARWFLYLHKTYQPIAAGYEKYGKDSDIEHIESVQIQQNYRFDIIALGGPMKKTDRIKRLVPDCETGHFYLPFHCFHTNYEGQTIDMTKVFIDEEYTLFPMGLHDDLLDMLSRIKDEDLGAVYPKLKKKTRLKRRRDARVV